MKASKLTPQQFKLWRLSSNLSQSAAARMLGLSHSSIFAYEQGERKEGKVKIPHLVALGMSAISAGLTPYEGEEHVDSI